MDIKHIKSLAEILKANGLSVLEVTEGENKIRLEKNNSELTEPKYITVKPEENVSNIINTPVEKGVDFNDITEVKSPIVGIFYASPSPKSETYVKIGDKIKKGTVLCLVEAMKLMNEICSDCDGEIVDICAQNEQVVEYGQTLFKIY